ncbi:MAG: Mg2+ and Co2+ transporter CorB [Hyphomonadaceae bacterium]|nr:Mg2+ and Co2+ transporter CorB [Clostridia bacterium]
MQQPKSHKKFHLRNTNGGHKRFNFKWLIIIVIWTFILSVTMDFSTSILMENVRVSQAFFVLIFIILIGIFFDIIGVAVTAAKEAPFHSLAARRTRGALQAIAMIRNAEKVANFCADVIGDITGILSGATAAVIAAQIALNYHSFSDLVMGLVITGMVASLTVGGKSLGKTYAMGNANQIVFRVALLITWLKEIFSFHKTKKRR